MPNYRRNYAGTCFFFTLVTHARRNIFVAESARQLLRESIERTRAERPWQTMAVVLLPDHLHMLWRLPDGDTDYSSRIAAMKKRFTRPFLASGETEAAVPQGQKRHRLRGVWQRRFWEHTIRDERELRMHLDYIPANPVKHGLVSRPADWEWSSFHRYVQIGAYEADWCGQVDLPGSVEYLGCE